jgi:molecular chaperone DnaJ
MKDCYKILDVKATATHGEIRKSYRALAFKYHPDKNPGNSLSEAHFKEIQEAYGILSDATRRAIYDDERWLSGVGGSTSQAQAITPQWLEKTVLELTASLATMDTYRLSKEALRAYILLILADDHLAILKQYDEVKINRLIVSEILKAAAKLDLRQLDEIENRLITLAGNDDEMLQDIDDTIEDRKRTALMEKLLPYFIIIVTLALCAMMYFYGNI